MLAMSLWLNETVSSVPRESSTPKSSDRIEHCDRNASVEIGVEQAGGAPQ